MTVQELAQKNPKLVCGNVMELYPTLVGKFIIPLHYIGQMTNAITMYYRIVGCEIEKNSATLIEEVITPSKVWISESTAGKNCSSHYLVWE